MAPIVDQISNQLAEKKAELAELREKLTRNEASREDLFPYVQAYKQLRKESKEIENTISEKQNQLQTIMDFIEEATGEKTYPIFPLFNQQTEDHYQKDAVSA